MMTVTMMAMVTMMMVMMVDIRRKERSNRTMSSSKMEPLVNNIIDQ